MKYLIILLLPLYSHAQMDSKDSARFKDVVDKVAQLNVQVHIAAIKGEIIELNRQIQASFNLIDTCLLVSHNYADAEVFIRDIQWDNNQIPLLQKKLKEWELYLKPIKSLK